MRWKESLNPETLMFRMVSPHPLPSRTKLAHDGSPGDQNYNLFQSHNELIRTIALSVEGHIMRLKRQLNFW